MITSFQTPYGKVTLLDNEEYITKVFKLGGYWDMETLLKLQTVINPNKSIVEIGGHCGTSSLVYASFLSDPCIVQVYEPQQGMFNLLNYNITENNLTHKIHPKNLAIFCEDRTVTMNHRDLDGKDQSIVQLRYTSESHLPCNFGGIGLGGTGENVNCRTLDSLLDANELPESIGFIHCDAQGAENFIFAAGTKTLETHRPIILFESNAKYCRYYHDNILLHYPEYENESKFDIVDYCMNNLKYQTCIECFNGSIDTLLIP